ncbi:PAS domain-containing protein [Myxococcota bacterium]|nr:PAS domain-containing protein [Myxococcota bacterium]
MGDFDERASPRLGPIYARVIADISLGVIVWRLVDHRDARTLTLVDANAAASRLVARDLGASTGRTFLDVFPGTPEALLDRFASVARTGASLDFSDVTYGDDHVPATVYDYAILAIGDGIIAVVFDDVSDARRTEREIDETRRFFASIVENIPDMIFIKEARELRFVSVNRAGEALIGRTREELAGKGDHDFFPREQADAFVAKDREVLARGQVVEIAEELLDTARGPRWLHTKKMPIVDETGAPRYLLGIAEDITERREAQEALRRTHDELERRVEERTRALAEANEGLRREMADRMKAESALARSQEQLRHAQKMEAIGRLAGGIAHDFNNILSVILGYAEMMLEDFRPHDPLHRDLAEVKKAADRGAGLTRQLLAFSRQQVLEPRVVDLNEVLGNMDRMLRRMLGEDVELRSHAARDLGLVKVDPGQIEQVVMNLAVNAREAMPQGGKLTIETANVDLDAAFAAEHLGIAPGPHVMLAVSDNGVGMDRATQARIFEPFFTTKATGTGLGLATVFGIVRQSGGSIWVYSEPGQGSSFKVYLPRATGEMKLAPTHEQVVDLRGSETLLLVEDEEQVRTLGLNILRRFGYHVLEAKNAGEALLIAEGHPGVIDLLVTDVVMPHVSGHKLAERLVAARPGLRVLFMSGYTDQTMEHRGELVRGAAFLQKPLTPELLARKVREVLGPSSAS